MAKLALICLTAVIIGFTKYIAGPVMLKEMDIDFMQSIDGATVIPQGHGPSKIVFHSLFPLVTSAPIGQPVPPPDLPPEPDIEPQPRDLAQPDFTRPVR